ncbi:MAG: alpha/beta hydrolase [Desulfurococcaceae archaeon]
MEYLENYFHLDTGIKVFYRCYFPKGNEDIVIGVHGIAEHGGRYSHLGEYLSSNGYGFCIMDLRGHGKTAEYTEKGYVDKFEEFIYDLDSFISKIIKQTGHTRVHLLGHSMGGLIAVYYAGYVGKNIKSLITSGAAVYLPIPIFTKILLTLVNTISPRSKAKLPINPAELSTDLETAKKYVEDPLVVKNLTLRLLAELYSASKRVWKYIENINVPVLIMHGEKDRVVPVEASKRLYNALKVEDKQLVIFPEMKHEILNEKNKKLVLETILKWLNNYK